MTTTQPDLQTILNVATETLDGIRGVKTEMESRFDTVEKRQDETIYTIVTVYATKEQYRAMNRKVNLALAIAIVTGLCALIALIVALTKQPASDSMLITILAMIGIP